MGGKYRRKEKCNMRKLCLTILLVLGFMVKLACQPYIIPYNTLRVWDADKMISEAPKIGLDKLEAMIDPIKLTYLDSSFTSTLINLEFKRGFLKKHYSQKGVCIYELPKYTFELAKKYNNKEAEKKLFEYYIRIPQYIKSDTIYLVHGQLNDFLGVLLRSNNPNISKRLQQDYKQWRRLAKTAEPKSYMSFEEIKKLSFMEAMEFKESNLYADCSYIALQLAGALNYLKVEGFDNELLENLKKQQTWPYVDRYEFKIFTPYGDWPAEAVFNTDLITDFKKDYQKIEKFLFKNVENGPGQKITEIIYNSTKAYVEVLGITYGDYYLLTLNTNNTISIEYKGGYLE